MRYATVLFIVFVSFAYPAHAQLTPNKPCFQNCPPAQPMTTKEMRSLAEHGEPSAQYVTASCYEYGPPASECNQDFSEAAKWYRKAAEQGFAGAQRKLGTLYDRGLGVEHDPKEAIKWYRKASEQGDGEGQIMLGYHFYRGDGIPLDDQEAYYWVSLGAYNLATEHLRPEQIGAVQKRLETEIQKGTTAAPPAPAVKPQ